MIQLELCVLFRAAVKDNMLQMYTLLVIDTFFPVLKADHGKFICDKRVPFDV